MNKIISTSFQQTQQLGKEFAENLNGGDVVCLYGDLGAGKTTFVQGLAEGLGISKKIISPTFIIMRTYAIEGEGERVKGKGAQHLYHVDLYRIETEHDVEGLGLLELLGDPESIVLIEWPDKIENVLPEHRKDIYFRYLEDDKREIRFA